MQDCLIRLSAHTGKQSCSLMTNTAHGWARFTFIARSRSKLSVSASQDNGGPTSCLRKAFYERQPVDSCTAMSHYSDSWMPCPKLVALSKAPWLESVSFLVIPAYVSQFSLHPPALLSVSTPVLVCQDCAYGARQQSQRCRKGPGASATYCVSSSSLIDALPGWAYDDAQRAQSVPGSREQQRP
jgi:hypothetical protein